MIVISEYRLTMEEIDNYHEKGYRVAYGYDVPYIKPGESVGILLDTLYKTTMELIDNLLFRHHKLTLKYKGQVYHLSSLEEWKHTYQSDKDMLKMKSEYHIIYATYLNQRREYYESQKEKTERNKFNKLYDYIEPVDIPNDEVLDEFLHTFGYLYQVDIDYSDRLAKLNAYIQLKFYLDNDIPYANEAPTIDIEDEPMFNITQFKVPPYEEPVEVTTFGDEIYLEDFIYKNSCNLN